LITISPRIAPICAIATTSAGLLNGPSFPWDSIRAARRDRRHPGPKRAGARHRSAAPVVTIVGRLTAIAHELFLRVAREVRQQPSAVFAIVGDGKPRGAGAMARQFTRGRALSWLAQDLHRVGAADVRAHSHQRRDPS
jgi:hypothetical protein